MLYVFVEEYDPENIFEELLYYVLRDLSTLLVSATADAKHSEELILLLAFVKSRYCRLRRLKKGLEHVAARIINDKLSSSARSRLLQLSSKLSRTSIGHVLRLRNEVLSVLRYRYANIRVITRYTTRDKWQCRGFMLVDSSKLAAFDFTTGTQFRVILNTFGSVKVRFNTLFLRARDLSITLSLTATPLDCKVRDDLITWRGEIEYHLS